MILKSIAVGAGACALVAGAAVAGTAAHASPSAPAQVRAATSAADLSDLAGTELAGSDLGSDSGAAAGAAAGTAAGTAAGAPGAADAAGAQTRARLCARVPLAIERTQNLEKRLAADVSTPGSLAYLQRRIDVAQAAHNTQLVATLTNRLTYRKQLAVFLPERLTLLQTAQRTVCAPDPAAPASS